MMKVSNEIISNLKKHQSSTPSKWRENAEWRVEKPRDFDPFGHAGLSPLATI